MGSGMYSDPNSGNPLPSIDGSGDANPKSVLFNS